MCMHLEYSIVSVDKILHFTNTFFIIIKNLWWKSDINDTKTFFLIWYTDNEEAILYLLSVNM